MATAAQVTGGAVSWAIKIAADNKYGYKHYNNNNGKLCPICHPGSGNGWNCIGLVTAAYHHGGGLTPKKGWCRNDGLGNDNWFNKSLTLSNWNSRNGPGWKEITEGKREKSIPTSKLKPGDVLVNFTDKYGSSYTHTFMYLGNDRIINVVKNLSRNKQISIIKYTESPYYKLYSRVFRFVGKTQTSTPKPKVPSTSSKKETSKKETKPVVRISRCADDVRRGAVTWALNIANDNSFHYGWGNEVNHNGCYFCGTQYMKQGHGVEGWDKTYCCNPFVGAAFAHGGGDPTALSMCQNCNSWDMGTGSGSYHSSSLFDNLGHPSVSSLIPGDVVCNSHHVMLYIGNAQVVHAYHRDDNVRNSDSWNSSISTSNLYDNDYDRAYRYIGNGGGVMDMGAAGVSGSTSDSGSGIEMRQAISKLYSSDNYTYIFKEKKESEAQKIASRFTSELRDALNKLEVKPIETSNAIPEAVVNKAIDISNFEQDKPKKTLSKKPSNLLSYPTLVEAPTIVLDFNGTKIGGYNNKGDLYPNYITSMKVNKINGRINNYTFNLSYQVRYGEDPNFIDKLIAKTGYLNPLKILYGDSNYPGAYYREESAIIIDSRQTEDVGSYTINYTITAVSSIALAQTSFKTFKNKKSKPSTEIYNLLYNSGEISKSLLELFPGMKNKTLVSSKGLIPTTDSIVEIGGIENVSPLTYLSYLVACMNNPEIKSSYYLTLVDNSMNDFNGSYFKISEVKKRENNILNIDSNYFELDIGYPTDNNVLNFQLCNNDYWSLVYKYSGNISKFEYGIDDDGNLIESEDNILYKNNKYDESSLISSNWWKQVTEFPISAKVTIKGLLSPAILMSYVKINALFYGFRDVASGLYVVTAQEDSISGSGYATELTLLRVAGE